MSAEWVAGSVRAKSIARHRLGSAATRELAGKSTTELALHVLIETPYGHNIRPGQTVAQAQHAVRAALLWHLRVLAGWQPRAGAELNRPGFVGGCVVYATSRSGVAVLACR
jgi:hypothetical protein